MKRRIKPKRWIEIVLYINPSLPQDMAAVELHHPSSRFKLTDEELLIYSDFVESMISPIYAHGFKIVKDYQSNKSYSYYIDFYPVDKKGNLLDKVHIIFRLSEHVDKSKFHSSSRIFIKSFVINDISYDKMLPFQDRINYICDRLAEGDYDELITRPTEFV